MENVCVRGLRARAVELPLQQALETSLGRFSVWPVVIVDLETDAGHTGRSFMGCFNRLLVEPLVQLLVECGRLVAGRRLAPVSMNRELRDATRILGHDGLMGSAIALLDVAGWDALAKVADVPLARLLGAEPRPLPVYRTITAMDPGKASQLAIAAVDAGYGGVKLKLGAPTAAADLKLVMEVRNAVGAELPLMGDFNQVLSIPEAQTRFHMLKDAGLAWFEEPVESSDLQGNADLSRRTHVPLQLGENWRGERDALEAVRHSICHLAMPDLIRIGGVGAWLRAATIVDVAGKPVSSHSYPEVCAHLLPCLQHAHWLEHVGLVDVMLANPVRPIDGKYSPEEAPGSGVEWNDDVIKRHLVLDRFTDPRADLHTGPGQA